MVRSHLMAGFTLVCNLTFLRVVEPVYNVQHRTFTRAVGPDDRPYLSR